jgi:hypothetical protein
MPPTVKKGKVKGYAHNYPGYGLIPGVREDSYSARRNRSDERARVRRLESSYAPCGNEIKEGDGFHDIPPDEFYENFDGGDDA